MSVRAFQNRARFGLKVFGWLSAVDKVVILGRELGQFGRARPCQAVARRET